MTTQVKAIKDIRVFEEKPAYGPFIKNLLDIPFP